MCRRAAIPSSLDGAAEFLDLPQKKQTAVGKGLINKFCKLRKPTKDNPNTRNMPKDFPEDFRKFADYCLQDVRTERALFKRLKPFQLKGEVLESFHFDLVMNDRGVPVNVEGLKLANDLVNQFDKVYKERFVKVTGLSPTQRQKVLGWMQSKGYPGENMQAKTVQDILDLGPVATGMDKEAFEMLQLYTLTGFAALKKIPTMLNNANTDGVVRGSLMWSGAERTHRWSGAIIQPQNFKRPVIRDTETLYSFICSGSADMDTIAALWDNPLEAIASCIRHFIHPDKPCLDADYSAIEARINPWLCGAEDKLELFRQNAPLYERMGAIIFGKSVQEVIDKKKTEIWRFVGKQAELGCGYGAGDVKFKEMCKGFGQDIPQTLATKAVNAWRQDPVNLPIVSAWKAIDRAAKDAIRNPGGVYEGTPRIKFQYTNAGGFSALIMKLPSGHCLIYPKAYIKEGVTKTYKGETYQTDEIWFWGKVQNRWCWVGTYGAKLLENATQATAGDIMSHGALEAQSRGYGIFMLVHDQALSHWNRGTTHCPDDFVDALCTLPDWADGLPIAAEGGVVEFYTKD
jgi:DNA polymerase